MLMVLGEDDGLAQPVSVGHLHAARHQMFQDLINGIFIEQPPVQRLGLYGPRDVAIVIPLDCVPAFLLFLAQLARRPRGCCRFESCIET